MYSCLGCTLHKNTQLRYVPQWGLPPPRGRSAFPPLIILSTGSPSESAVSEPSHRGPLFLFPTLELFELVLACPILSSQRPKPCWFNPCSPAPSTAAPGPRELYGYSWKEGRRKRRQEKAVDSKSQLSGLWRGRTHAYLVGRGVFWFHAVAAAGLFGNCPLSGVLGPVTQGPQELGGGPADQSSSKYCSKLIDAMPGREGAGIFHT